MVHWKRPLSCEKCKFVTNVTSNMRRHVNDKHKYNVREKFSCKICEKVYLKKLALQAHARNFHSSEPKLQLSCDICAKNFVSTTSLNGHVKSIHNEKMFSCEQCDGIFSLKNALLDTRNQLMRDQYSHVKSVPVY